MNFTLIVLGLIMGIFLDWIIAKVSIKEKVKARFQRYRIHHSIYGLVLMVIGIFIYGDFLIPVGIGIILGHTARLKKLVFIGEA